MACAPCPALPPSSIHRPCRTTRAHTRPSTASSPPTSPSTRPPHPVPAAPSSPTPEVPLGPAPACPTATRPTPSLSATLSWVAQSHQPRSLSTVRGRYGTSAALHCLRSPWETRSSAVGPRLISSRASHCMGSQDAFRRCLSVRNTSDVSDVTCDSRMRVCARPCCPYCSQLSRVLIVCLPNTCVHAEILLI